MSITTRSEYGLRAMVLLAEQFGSERLSAREISRREGIPVKYLEQILAELKRADLVESRSGPRGGYRLRRPAHKIVVGEVIFALDGRVTPLVCDALDREAPAPGEPQQVGQRLRPLWERLGRAVRSVLDQTTLDQLAFTTCLDTPPVALRAGAEDQEDPDQRPTYHI